jgi:hypothetical protein
VSRLDRQVLLKVGALPDRDSVGSRFRRTARRVRAAMKSAVQAVVILIFLVVVSLQLVSAQGEHEGANIVGVQTSPDLKQIKIKFNGKAARPVAYVVERPNRLVMDFKSTGLGRVPAKITMNRGLLREIRTGSTSSRARVVLDFGENPVPPFSVSKQSELVILTLTEAHKSAGKSKPAPQSSSASPQAPPDRSSAAPTPSDDRKSENADSRFAVKAAGLSQDLIFVELADRKDPTRTYRLVMDFDYDSLQLRTATFSDALGNVKRFDIALNPASGDAPMVGSRRPPSPRGNWAAAAYGSQAKKAFKANKRVNKRAKRPGQPTVTQKGPACKEEPKTKRANLAK